eukprot:4112671-Amphidinium_carterae.3
MEDQERSEEEREDPQALWEIRNRLRTIHDEWSEAGRHQEAQLRHARRQLQDRERHQGTTAALQQRYQSLHHQVISARQVQLEAGQRVREAHHGNGQDGERVPRAPPQGLTVPTSRLPQPLTLQQLRERVQREEDRVQRAREGGYYTAPSPPQHFRDKDRLREFDKEELQRQAAQQEIPEERVVQVQEVQVQQAEAEEMQKYSKSTALLQALHQGHQDNQDSQNKLIHQTTQKRITGTIYWST